MRTCAVDICINRVFGTDKNTNIGYCKHHQYLRTDKKAKSFEIAKRSKRKPIHDLSFGFNSQPELFAYVWESTKNEKGRVICKFTGIDLTYLQHESNGKWLCCMAHVLNKKNYPYFKLNPANIRVVYPDFHTIVDQGTSDDRKKHPTWAFDQWDFELEQMKKQYKLFKKENLLP
jgi:hypothetical protein